MSGTGILFSGASIVGALMIGGAGMYGLRKEKNIWLVLSALVMPVFVFLALWSGIGFQEISFSFCLTAFLTLAGIRREKE